MKHLAITSLVSALLLAACNPPPPSSSASAAASTSSAVTSASSSAVTSASAPSTANLPVYRVRFAYEPYPPFNILLPDGSFDGLESDILNAIAKQEGFRVEAQPYVWEVIFKDLKQSNAHLVGGGLVDEDFDLTELVLSKPYMRSPDCVVAINPNHLKDWQKQKIVTVDSDELDDSLVKDYGVKRNNIQNVRTQYQALKTLSNKQATITVSDCHVLKHYIHGTLKNQEFSIQELPIDEGDTSYDLVFGVRKDETELLNKINKGIEQLKQSGEMDKIIKKWTTEQATPAISQPASEPSTK